jgi:translation initiation factor 1
LERDGSSSGIDGTAQIGQNQSVGRKQDKQPEGLEGGQLSHNPFAALAGKSQTPAEGKITLPGSVSADGGTSGGSGKTAKRGGSKKQSKGRAGAKAPGSPTGKLTVRFEAKGHGGKTVTRISGLTEDPQGLNELARELKKAMGAGARVEEDDVLVQGKLVERVAEWLTKRGHGQVIRGN